ncbi:hypothetical protein N8T08_006250 [Aspergillus melleus]|uniref:Uncharacterized protein n=1 Tax=Aspergillus melleus TaxID=138277 RepID=A0ACC3B0N0_9EURO|nr:hypothetical protein N8T08_006250 [Aspergillus melleus]
MSTQPPYHTSTFGAPNQDPSAATPIGTQVGAAPPTDPMTGPAPSTAGPHQSNMGNQLDPRVDSDRSNRDQHAPGTTTAGNAHHTSHNQGYNQSSNAGPHSSSVMNKVDPRVDSDLDNRAQYAPGTTASGNAQPGTTQDNAYSHGANDGPHSSSMMNKADPRVDAQTGETSTKTTTQTGSGAVHTPADTSSHAAGAGYGSTAGHAPIHARANPEHEAKYVPHGEQRGYDTTTATGSSGTGSKSAQKGEKLGNNVKSMFAGIHGAGESLRGGLTSAVDKAFGHEEGAAKNAEIANKGDRQIQSGQFGRNAH